MVFDDLADTTWKKTMKEMIGLPARTADDALAALDWLVRDDAELDVIRMYGPDNIVASLVTAIRGYLVAMGGRS